MIDDMKPADWGVVAAAAIMALGAFCPIVSMPVVGSLNYMMGGQGDGVFIVGAAVAIVVMVITGHRKKSAFLAAGCLLFMLLALVQAAAKLSEFQSETAHQAKSAGAFGGIITMFSKSVGLEWGWFLLVGGAIGALIIAVFVGRDGGAGLKASVAVNHPASEGDFSTADRLIEAYLEQPKKPTPPTRQFTTFGKR